MPLNITRQPRRIYKENPLKLVICQIRYPVELQFGQEMVGAFQSAIRSEYPRVKREQHIGVIIGPGGAAPAESGETWRFEDVTGDWSVAISNDFVSLEARAYDRYENFRARLESLIEATRSIGISAVERLGVRYINEFRNDEGNAPSWWRSKLNAELLGMVGGAILGDDVIHAIEEIRLREDGGVFVIRHGFVGAEPTQGQPHYLMDMDFYSDEMRALDGGGILPLCDGYHTTIKDVFETSITDDMRELLGVLEVIGA
jgi:uncharacterized protein (TIGR04255 family)